MGHGDSPFCPKVERAPPESTPDEDYSHTQAPARTTARTRAQPQSPCFARERRDRPSFGTAWGRRGGSVEEEQAWRLTSSRGRSSSRGREPTGTRSPQRSKSSYPPAQGNARPPAQEGASAVAGRDRPPSRCLARGSSHARSADAE